MINVHYWTVIISIVSSIILLFGLIFYRWIYPKKSISLFSLLILISLLPMLSLLRPGTYESGDFNIHLYRIMAFYDSLREGILMPSWAAELNATYGNPLFIFNYNLSYYAVSLLHFIGFSFISSLKIYLGLCFFLSGIFMYLWVYKLTGKAIGGFTAGIFYLFNPYHLIDFHFRATPGESTVFMVAPLVLLFSTLYFKTKKIHFLILQTLSIIFLLMGHPLVAITIFGILILFIIFQYGQKRDNERLILSILSLAIGVVATIYLWFPYFLYAPYMFVLPVRELVYYPFDQLFYSPWKYGFLFQGHKGELALIIGYVQVFIVFVTIIALVKNRVSRVGRASVIFWLSIFFLILFLMHPSSKFIWNHFQFSWMLLPFGRLLLPVALCTSVIAGYFVVIYSNSKRKKYFIYMFLFLAVGSTILNWGHRRVIPEINDSVFRKNVWISTINEGPSYFANTKWADFNNFWFSELPKHSIEIKHGDGTIKKLERTSIRHTYIINAQTPVTIRENTLFFPGWSLNSNGKLVDIYPGERGVIYSNLPQGLQYLELNYKDIPQHNLSKIVNVVIIFILFLLLIITKIHKMPLSLKFKNFRYYFFVFFLVF